MAVHNVVINYPDGKQAELLAALRLKYGQIRENDTIRDRTPAECKQAFDSEVRSLLTAIYKDYKRREQVIVDLEATI